MGKHTPGPWKYTVDPNGENFHLFATELADGEERIIGGCGCCGSPWMGGDNHDANARLIAAAPELLFQLLAAANYIDALGGDSKSYRAAIAKATAG